MKNELDEKANEIAVLKVQTTAYAADFQQEREDRTRSQSRVIELEEQLAAASQRIAELEDDRRRVSATARHQVRNASSLFGLFLETDTGTHTQFLADDGCGLAYPAGCVSVCLCGVDVLWFWYEDYHRGWPLCVR